MDREPKGFRNLGSKTKPLHDGSRHSLAALAGKLERIHQNRADLLIQLVAN
jgi:hypothetical protein